MVFYTRAEYARSVSDCLSNTSELADWLTCKKNSSLSYGPGGGGGTPLQEANRDVPLDHDGVAFSRLE